MKCPYCNADVVVRSAKDIYHTDRFTGFVHVCSNFPKCDAYVGCHMNTKVPLGRLANKKLRGLKSKAHLQFDVLWKSGQMQRPTAYKWLASKLGIKNHECHIGMFNEEQCIKVAELGKAFHTEKVDKYREENGINTPKEMFTRGYQGCRSTSQSK